MFDLGSTRHALDCAAVGTVLAQRSLEDDIHDVMYTPRKGDKVEGKLQVVLQAIIDTGVVVKVKLKQRKLKKKTNFPPDLVEEILSRVPATSLKRLRSSCKRWNSLFKDHRFAEKHFHKAPRESHLIMLNEFMFCPMNVNLNVFPPSVEFKDEVSLKDFHSNESEEVYISDCFYCDGLLLCTDTYDRLVDTQTPHLAVATKSLCVIEQLLKSMSLALVRGRFLMTLLLTKYQMVACLSREILTGPIHI
ncbi:hypothetical protein HID58_067265 [Brassica napus]|uniref:F-box domain-containing protein n=1 Tax=Brassica napus TaxID=3708 RepID=A0ABQ7ZI25_BRANA|nr:hypothetical protein HID58_067265 [Brassica napus]